MSKLNYNRLSKAYVPWYDEANIKKFGKYPKKYSTLPKKLKAKAKRDDRKQAQKARLAKMADKLNANRPFSELWFENLFSTEPISKHISFLTNTPLGFFIPDFLNDKYRIVIEIDGSIHNHPHIIKKDKKKDKFYKEKGYKVIRIKAFNQQSYSEGISKLTLLLTNKLGVYPHNSSKIVVRKKD